MYHDWHELPIDHHDGLYLIMRELTRGKVDTDPIRIILMEELVGKNAGE